MDKIPRYIGDLNRLAELHGINTSIVFGPDRNNPEIRLWAKWTGTCEHLQAVGLFARHQLARLVRTWRRRSRVRRLMLTVPSSEPPWCNPLLQGEIEVLGDHFEWSLDFGPGDFSLTDQGDVEVITYVDGVVLYGRAEALVRAGVERERLPLGLRTAKSSHGDDPRWYSRRVPNGLHLYGFQTRAIRPCLRLVVDNTRRTAPIPQRRA